MVKNMEMAEGEDKLLGDMLEVIRFTEGVSAKLHRVLDEAKIYQVVKEEFAKSDRYTAGILLLDGDGASLKLAEISMTPSKLKVLERASGLQAKEYLIKLSKSSICRQVVREDKTVHANVSDIVSEFLPRPLAYLISKTMGYDKQSSILTPLHRRGKVIGVLGVSCTELCEYLLHSVENLALHISTALELADEHAQRKRAVQSLKRYHDRLGELVEERTGELKAVNEKLREEITERKQAGEALRKIEQEKLAILNSMSELTVYQDTEHRILWTNKAAAESVALSIEQLAGRHCYEIWPQLSKPCVGCPVAKARETGKPQEAEMTTPDGRVWFVRGYPVLDANENLVGVVEVTLDITERKRAEWALRESREKFQKMFESVTDGISVVDLNGAIIEVNQRTVEMHGFASKDELLGRNASELVAPRDRERIAKNMRKATKEGTIRGVEYTLLKADGAEFAGELSTSVIKDASGKAVAHITIARDITRRKQAGEALRESEEKYKELAGSITDLFFAFDKDLRYTYWNKASEELTGIPAKDALGKHLYDIFPDSEMTKRAERAYRKALKTQKVQGFVNEYQLGDKDYFFEISAYPSKDGLAVFAKDITERKQADEALQSEKNKLQSLIDAMEDGLTIQDTEYNIIYQNEPVRVRHGDHLGEKCYRVYEGREKVCEGCPVEEAFRDGKSHTSERRVVLPSGEVTFWEVTANPIRDAGGRIVSCIEVPRNITERKQADEALQVEKNKLQSLVDAMEDGLTIQDTEYNIIYQNEPVRVRHGDHLGEKCYRVYEGKEKLCEGCPVEKAFKDGKSHTSERRVVAPSGEITFWEVTANPVRDAGGRIVSCIEVPRNITERKQADEALNLQRAYFQQLFDNSPDAIALMSDGGKVVQVNKGFETLFGYRAEEIEGRYLFDVIIPEDRIEEVAAVTRVTHSGKAVRKETVRRRQDGSLVDVSLLRYPIRFGSKIIGTYCIYTDITERKQADEALRESQKFSSSLMESSPNPITVVNPDTSIRYVNPAFEKLTGFALDEIVGSKAPYPWWPEAKRARILAAFKNVIEHGGRRTERNFQKKNGERFWVALNSAPVMHDGKPVYLIISWLDITERKQAEEQLQESEDYLQTIFDASTGGILIIEPETHQIVDANPAVIKMIGVGREEIIGRACHQFVCPAERGKCPITDLNQRVDTKECILLNASGEEVPALKSVVPITRYGRQYLLELVFDITERKQAEEKEKQLQQELYLAQRLASVGELAAGVAHEINNPLTGVLGFSQRLMRKSTDEKVSRDLEIIHSEAKRAAEVVQSLLTFARRRQPKKEYANINDIVQKTLELRAYALQTGNIEVVTTLAPGLPRIMADFPQMQEVFLNIILNAEQAMSEARGRGKLIIKTQRLKKYVRISFADDGPGISTGNLGKVFDPFFTTREGKGGTGLGLSACHGIVTEHGGKIYARSKGRKGATFFVELPLSPVEAAAAR